MAATSRVRGRRPAGCDARLDSDLAEPVRLVHGDRLTLAEAAELIGIRAA